MRPVSALLPTKCFTIAMTWVSWMARTSAAASRPARYGSSPIASGSRPPCATRAMSTAGPSSTLAPVSRASSATATLSSKVISASSLPARSLALRTAASP